jgi:hypothetical protein
MEGEGTEDVGEAEEMGAGHAGRGTQLVNDAAAHLTRSSSIAFTEGLDGRRKSE